jgi:hypothetical protein
MNSNLPRRLLAWDNFWVGRQPGSIAITSYKLLFVVPMQFLRQVSSTTSNRYFRRSDLGSEFMCAVVIEYPSLADIYHF